MIIQVLIPLVLVLVLILAYRSFSMDDDDEATSGSGVSAKDLEATLAKVLEKAHLVPTAAAASQMAGVKDDAQAQNLLKEIDRLKAELAEAKTGLEKAKTDGAGAPAAGAAAAPDTEKLNKQLEEMKARLAEYEIIAEDIADLSFYKEQTAKLQKEVETLKGGQPAAPAAAQADVMPANAPVKEEEISIAGSAKATAATQAVAEDLKVEEPKTEAAVATPAEATAEKATEPTNDQMLAADGPAPKQNEEGFDNILEEFNAVVEEKTGKKIDDLGELDMDKMLNEAANIKMDVPEVSAEQAIGVELDESKLIAEAADLGKAVSSEDQKLMGQFEKFVKNE